MHAGWNLCGWDLFHAHLFLYTTREGDGEGEGGSSSIDVGSCSIDVGSCSIDSYSADIGSLAGALAGALGSRDAVGGAGLLFHAKEHPREFTLSSTAIRTVGSELTGGLRDPRTNTRLSVLERSFCERNAIWLSTTNTTHVLLPNALGFPVALLSPFTAYHFATVSETALTNALGPICDINYFADPARPQAPAPVGCRRPGGVTVSVYEPHASVLQGKSDTAAASAAARHEATLSTAAREGLHFAYKAASPPPAGEPSSPNVTPTILPTPPVNEKVAAVLRMQLRHSQIQASARFERLLAGRPTAPSRHGGGLWVCLIGGEWAGAMHPDEAGTRPGAWLGSHTSLQAVGRAYETLAPMVGADHVIVIAQLSETLAWLEDATRDAEACLRVAGSARHLKLLRRRLRDTRRDCAALIADCAGIADYDGSDVNPATLLKVLQGDASRVGGGRVVPSSASSVLVLTCSHGSAHPRLKDKPECGQEHFVYFPHPIWPEDSHLYDVVAFSGDDGHTPPKWFPGGPPKACYRLYSTMLFQALLNVKQRFPKRQTILLNQCCLSAGQARFLFDPRYQQHFRTSDWPVLHMATAGQFENSLGDFWDLWLDELSHAVERPACRLTLADIYGAAEQRYYERNRGLRKHNEQNEQSNPEAKAIDYGTDGVPLSLSFGTVGLHAGRTSDGRAMGEVPIWDLLLESAVVPEDAHH